MYGACIIIFFVMCYKTYFKKCDKGTNIIFVRDISYDNVVVSLVVCFHREAVAAGWFHVGVEGRDAVGETRHGGRRANTPQK